ncbi:hypothetical protein CUMW_001550 [Citrus unshiu]|nr:hypothetical protein CUMW_001550 [Citrus unshiu]
MVKPLCGIRNRSSAQASQKKQLSQPSRKTLSNKASSLASILLLPVLRGQQLQIPLVRVRGFEQLWSKNWWSYLTPQRKRRTRRPLTECRPVGPRCRDVSTP